VRRTLLALLVLGLVSCGGGDDPGATAGTTTTVAAAPEHGTILAKHAVDAGLGVPTYAVRYASESVAGDPIEVSGLVAVPERVGPTTPVLSWAHGTTGIADVCAPSRDPKAAIGWLQPFVDKGWIVTATDYEGLGTPGRHPYINGTSEGRSTLDAVRAAREVAGTSAGPVLVWGHSQGGHAALWAGQLAKTWTPELDVVGVVAGAPATELPLIAKALRNGPFQGYLALGAAGLNAAEPKRADLSLVLSPKALGLLDVVDRECADGVHEVFSALPYDQFAIADPGEIEPWRSILLENDPGHMKTDIPVYLYQGEADEQIPVVASKLLFDRLCTLGQVVERHTYPGQRHSQVIGVALDGFTRWMEARVAGEPVASGCSPSG
jgi:pimeloyl-ACP methyl ester carboxylesterase